VAPHSLAAQSAVSIMREGGNAVEAMIAAAATIAVVYPHMNGIGGDGFWLIARPGSGPIGIEACGAAGKAASIDQYRDAGFSTIPFRGGYAANTVAGTVGGWDAAYQWSSDHLQGRLPLRRLLNDAIEFADNGISVTQSQARCLTAKSAELKQVSGFVETFIPDGHPPVAGDIFRQRRLGDTLAHLAKAGFDDFYRGELAKSIAKDLQAAGSFLSLSDLQAYRAQFVKPLVLKHSLGHIFNMPPPTQGLVSLLILGQLDRILGKNMPAESAEFVHACVEATKQAFIIRDKYITDPRYMQVFPQELLADTEIDRMANQLSLTKAAPWPPGKGPGDTVWMGAIDKEGVAVSFIQSIYHEFGSGIVLNKSGINWQNRGASFSLNPASLNPLGPGRKPFHTLNPALARLNDGRSIVYGNMGGDGQPQSQSAVFSRLTNFSMNAAQALDAPRWLLGRTWGQESETLKLEDRFGPATIEQLRRLGHEVEIVAAYDETMGHAGAVIKYANGTYEGSSDPRSDGAAIGW
jgi:gamma-glutamyltranspeptidase/glutathione hydrolase